MSEKLYTAKELASILRVHEKTIYRLGREGKLRRVKVGRSVRFLMPRKEKHEKRSERNIESV
jgi:excisionase family DNA binding protein